MRAAIYARVSTANMGQDPTMQTRELEEFCQCRGWDITGRYVDQGVSGAKDSRPELNRLMADAHSRRFDVIAVWKFDRFAWSVSHLLRALETFQSLGIEFVSLSEQIDTSTPTGKMVFTILGAVAELERSLIVDRVRAYAVAGRRAEALKVLDELTARSRQRHVPAYYIALIYAALGEKDNAFAWLDRAYTQRSWYLTSLKVDPKVDSLRSDPRFADLVRRVGLP
jgi:DNA invertase Pin-like site-specific DNA recombinase